MINRYIILIVLSFKLFGFAAAQQRMPGKPIVKNYSSLEYGGGLQNWAVVQDHRQILFIGNRFGVLKFDGVRWDLIELEKKTIGRSLAVDSLGKVYVGGQGEFGCLEGDSIGRLHYVPLWKSLPKSFHGFEDVWRIHLTHLGVAFSTVRGLFIYANGSLSVVEPTEKGNLFDRAYYCNKTLFVQEIGKGLLEWKNDALQLIPSGELFSTDQIKEILPLTEEASLILTFSKGIFLYKDGGVRPWKVPINSYVQENLIYSAIQLQNGTYAIGTSEKGVVTFDKKGNIFQSVDRSDGLQNNTVLSMCEDQLGNLWAGLDNGLSYIESNSPFTQLAGKQELQGTPYTSMVWEGKLYLGTTNGVFYTELNSLYDPLSDTQFRLLENTKGQAYKLQIVGGELLLAHHQGAFSIKNGKTVPLKGTEGAWTFKELADHPGYMIGGTYTGLDLYKKNSQDRWQFVKNFPSFTESSRMIEQDEEGNIWIAHGNKGVFSITFTDNLESIQSLKLYNSTDGFPSDIFIDVHRLGGKLVFSAEEGCFRYDKDTDRFVPHEILNQQFGKKAYIRELIEDSLGNVWYQVDDQFGVLQIKDDGLQKHVERISVGKLNGKLLPGFEHINPHAFGGGVLLGTQQGFVYFDPSEYATIQHDFRTLIRGVEAISTSDSLLFRGRFPATNENGSGNSSYKVPTTLNSLRFIFAAPFYEDVEKMQYSYMLEGFTEDWSEWGNSVEKEYTNLAEGDYIFRVKARNIYQQESEPGVFSFSIHVPWYRRRLAVIVYLGLCIGGLVLYFKRQNRTLLKEKEQLKADQEITLKKKDEDFFRQKIQAEKEIMYLKNEKLQSEISHKTQELTSSAIHLVQKGEILLKIKQELEKMKGEMGGSSKNKMEKLIKTIEDDIKLDKNWEKFEYHFDSVHENFLKSIREQFPMLTPKDQKMCAYLRMNLSTKEIAPLMNISVRGVEISRYRLRKKMNLEAGTNLVEFLLQIKTKNLDS